MDDAEYREIMGALGHLIGFLLAWLIAWVVLH